MLGLVLQRLTPDFNFTRHFLRRIIISHPLFNRSAVSTKTGVSGSWSLHMHSHTAAAIRHVSPLLHGEAAQL